VVGNPNPVNGPSQSVPATPNFERYKLHQDAAGNRLLTIAGLDHPKRSYDLVEGLIRRRYTDEHIRLILGGNARRVMAAIWAGGAAG